MAISNPTAANPGTLRFWDLFCGGSGAGTGVTRAISRLGYNPQCIGINHNQKAVATSRKNHPEHTFLCTGVDDVTPRVLFPDGADFGFGSPACTFHSSARGGKPINDQERSSAWSVWRWANQTRPRAVMVENVKEFQDWGPLMHKRCRKTGKLVWVHSIDSGGKRRRIETTEVPFEQSKRTWDRYLCDLAARGFRPCEIKDPAHKGETFARWKKRGEALGYIIDHRVINTADYGDPTSRQRLFVQCVRPDAGMKIVWPKATHAKPDRAGQVPHGLKPWRTAREILDFSDLGKSVFERKKPLSPKTLRRIRIGLIKYGLSPFIVPKQGYDDRTRPTSLPLQTVATTDRGIGLVQPATFMVPGFGDRAGQTPRTHDVDKAMPSITASGHHHLASSVPIPTIEGLGAAKFRCVNCGNWMWEKHPECPTCLENTVADVAEAAFIVPKLGIYQQNQARSVDLPIPTIITDGRMHLAQSFIVPQQRGGKQVKSVDEPVSPLTTTGAEALVTSGFVVQVAHGNEAGKEDDSRRAKSLDAPLPCITGSGEFAVANSFLIPQQRGVDARPLNRPVPTVVARGHTDLVSAALIKLKGTGTANSADEPLGTVAAGGGHHALMSSFVMATDNCGCNGSQVRPDSAPLSTITTKLHHGVVNSCMVQTAHEGADESRVKAISDPVTTIAGNRGDTAVISFAVPALNGNGPREAVLHFNGLFPGGSGRPVLQVGEDRYEIEIFFRMLKVVELARAQSFPENYFFCGTKTDAVKQIGNAVPGATAEALTLAVLSQCEDFSQFLTEVAA